MTGKDFAGKLSDSMRRARQTDPAPQTRPAPAIAPDAPGKRALPVQPSPAVRSGSSHPLPVWPD